MNASAFSWPRRGCCHRSPFSVFSAISVAMSWRMRVAMGLFCDFHGDELENAHCPGSSL